jgi:hypothetical protein
MPTAWTNLTEDEERLARQQAQEHPPSYAEMVGEDLGVPTFLEQPRPPGPRDTATQIARRRRSLEQAAAAERDLALIDRVSVQDQEDAALVEASKLRQAGRKVPPATLALWPRPPRVAGARAWFPRPSSMPPRP